MGFFRDAFHHAKLYLELDPEGDFQEDTEDLLEVLSFEAEDLEDEFYPQDDLIVKQEKARDLLETTCLSIKQIMPLVGMSDKDNFRRDFKKAYGLPPKQYRNNSPLPRNIMPVKQRPIEA